MVKIITNLEKKMEKIQGSINYNLEELNNKQSKNTNPIISRQDYHLIQPCPSVEKQTKLNKKLSTKLTLYEVYANHWTKLRRAETKRKKEFNLEAWEKETSNTIS